MLRVFDGAGIAFLAYTASLQRGHVIGSVLAGNATAALTSLSTNAQRLVKDPAGRTALIQAIAIAAIGTAARKALPGTKLGGKTLYLTI